MAIYDESLENIIENPDLDKGHIESRKKFVKHHDEQKREVKYEVMEGTITNSNPNGLRREIEITPYLAAYDEYEDVNVYVLYTEEELKQKVLASLKIPKAELSKTKKNTVKPRKILMESLKTLASLAEEFSILAGIVSNNFLILEGEHNSIF